MYNLVYANIQHPRREKKIMIFFPIRPEIHKKKKPRRQIDKKERYMDTGCKKMFSQCDGHILAFQGGQPE